jgi:hypothetical protein
MKVDTYRDYVCFAKTHSRGYVKDIVSRVYKSMMYDRGALHGALMAYKRIKHGR